MLLDKKNPKANETAWLRNGYWLHVRKKALDSLVQSKLFQREAGLRFEEVSDALGSDGSEGVVAQVELNESSLGQHDAAAEVLQSRRNLRLHSSSEHVLPEGPLELWVLGKSLTDNLSGLDADRVAVHSEGLHGLGFQNFLGDLGSFRSGVQPEAQVLKAELVRVGCLHGLQFFHFGAGDSEDGAGRSSGCAGRGFSRLGRPSRGGAGLQRVARRTLCHSGVVSAHAAGTFPRVGLGLELLERGQLLHFALQADAGVDSLEN